MDYPLTPRELARQDAVIAKIIADAAHEGLTVNASDLKLLPSVRMATLTDLGLDPTAMTEVYRIPSVTAQIRQKEVARQLEDPASDIHKEIGRLNPWQRLTLGHEMERAKEKAEKKPLTVEEEARAVLVIRNISDPAERLTVARRLGLA